jgi:hypothetical protein
LRPPDVRIDLAHPQIPDDLRAMLDAAGPLADALDWRLEAALEQAARETGLEDFGEDLYSEPFRVLLAALEDEAGLNAPGRLSCFGLIVSLLKNRLLVEDQIARHPEIEELPVAQPIVIAGLPRTGTTHLHNLMAADPALRSLPYWESLEPVPPLAEQGRPPGAPEDDPRFQRCAEACALQDRALPHFKRMHEMTPAHVHEEIQLLGIGGSTMLFETLAPVPSWRDWYLATDQTPWYRYLKRVLRVLQFRRGGERWVLKSPQHLEQFAPLLAAFPDAVVVVTHRDPVAITASFLTMVCYGAHLSQDAPDVGRIGRYWADRIEGLLRACTESRGVLPAERSLDVRFEEFMKDDVAMVERIYRLAGQPFGPDVLAAMEDFMAAHPRGRHGRVRYDLADFGLTPEERRTALAFYSERFGIASEASP